MILKFVLTSHKFPSSSFAVPCLTSLAFSSSQLTLSLGCFVFSPDLVRADFYLNGLWHDFSLIGALEGAEDDLRALIEVLRVLPNYPE